MISRIREIALCGVARISLSEIVKSSRLATWTVKYLMCSKFAQNCLFLCLSQPGKKKKKKKKEGALLAV